MSSKGEGFIIENKKSGAREYYELAASVMWFNQKFSFEEDRKSFEKALPQEQRLLKYVFGFFIFADGVVIENLVARFIRDISADLFDDEVDMHFVTGFFNIQGVMELEHGLTYTRTTDEIAPDEASKREIKTFVEHSQAVRRKFPFMEKYLKGDQTFGTRLFAFALAEGLFFQVSFAIIFYFRGSGRFRSIIDSNGEISRDEELHFLFATYLFKHLKPEHRPDPRLLVQMLREAAGFEQEFVTEMMPEALPKLAPADLKTYVEYTADRIAKAFDLEALFGAENPLEYMEQMGLRDWNNFFETRVSEYEKSRRPWNLRNVNLGNLVY